MPPICKNSATSEEIYNYIRTLRIAPGPSPGMAQLIASIAAPPTPPKMPFAK
ncbi:MAG: hypothetical protein ACYC4H_12280 [Desulfocucumaceae bacterium]